MEAAKAWFDSFLELLQPYIGTVVGAGKNPTVLVVAAILLLWFLVAGLLALRIMRKSKAGESGVAAELGDAQTAQPSDSHAVGQGGSADTAIAAGGSSGPPSPTPATGDAPSNASATGSASGAAIPAEEEEGPGLKIAAFSKIDVSALDGALDFPEAEWQGPDEPHVPASPVAADELEILTDDDIDLTLQSELEPSDGDQAPAVAVRPAAEAVSPEHQKGPSPPVADAQASPAPDAEPQAAPDSAPAGLAGDPAAKSGAEPAERAGVVEEGEGVVEAAAAPAPSALTREPPTIRVGNLPMQELHDRGYARVRSSFELFLRSEVQTVLSSARLVHVGLRGEPVLNTFPDLFWRGTPDFFAEELHERTDAMVAELGFHALRAQHFRPASDPRDRAVAVALFHYAISRMRLDLLLSLLARLDERGQLFAELREAGVVTLQLLGEERFAQHLEREPLTDAYHVAVQAVLEGGPYLERRFDQAVGLAESVSATSRVAWLRAAVRGETALERRAVDRLAREADGPLQSRELVVALLSRGSLFRAARLLYRLQRVDRGCGTMLLELYFRNGKLVQYLRCLTRIGPLSGRRPYYQACFCCFGLGLGIDATLRLREQGLLLDVPPQAERLRFERHVEAIAAGRFESARSPQRYGDRVALLYSYAQQELALATSDRQRHYVRELARTFRNELTDPSALLNSESLLRFAVWGFLYLGQRAFPRSLVPVLESLAGRNIAARLLLGLFYDESGQPSRALVALERAGRHPLVLHRLVRLYRQSGELERAERMAARLVRTYPGEATFWHNYAVLLELNGNRRRSEQAYARAVELEPQLASAAGRMSRLIELRSL